MYVLLKSIYLYCNLKSSLVASSLTLKGVVLDVLSIVKSLATISILPVDISGLSVPSSLFFTMPHTSSTYSERIACAASNISLSSGLKTTCTSPV